MSNRKTKGGGRTRVLIAGGGVAAVEALLALRSLAEERVDIELLSPEADFTYRPLSIAQPFDRGRAYRFQLADIAAERGARLRIDALERVDAEAGIVRTASGAELSSDALLIACGARPRKWLTGSLTYIGPADAAAMRQVLEELESGTIRDVAFALPGGAGWSLPLYELALMTAAWLSERGVEGTRLRFITPETAPLELFGRQASEAVAGLLADRGITLRTETYPVAIQGDGVELVPKHWIPAQRVITLPRLEGPELAGLDHDANGFLPVDEHCRVRGLSDVYAAGDITDFPIKQGGIAAQQADTAAAEIAAQAGAAVERAPFRPVLRGLLLTGKSPEFLRAELSGGRGESSTAAPQPLWWPPGKIAGKHLAPYLAALATNAVPVLPPRGDGTLKIELELEPAKSGEGVRQS